MINNLWVILPVYNEEQSITHVINEWDAELKKSNVNYTICAINDGSKDNTLEILDEIHKTNKNLKIINKENTGHGQTCIYGYKYAIKEGADWILQLDSDGQCDVSFLNKFINKVTNESENLFGNRKSRDDGFNRVIISKFVSLFIFLSTGFWIKDGNVPYRLMSSKELSKIINKIPLDFHLANILVSVLLKKESKIIWIPIHFNKRFAGNPSVKSFSFIKHGVKLFKQLNQSINKK
jgi:dolichol-phosphate mannosyltransferase